MLDQHRPVLLKTQGFTDWPWPKVRVPLAQPILRKDHCRHYLRVWLEQGEQGPEAVLTGNQGSGILSSLVLADGLAVIREEADHLPAGAEVEVLLLR